MIQSEAITELPNIPWGDNSSKEFQLVPVEKQRELITASWPVRYYHDDETPLLIAGLFRPTLLSLPYLWVLLAEQFTFAKPSQLRAIRQELSDVSPCETLIEFGNEKAVRLAKMMGLKETDRGVCINGLQFQVYRRTQ